MTRIEREGEAMPSINRRNALAITGAGLSAALAGLSATPTARAAPALSPDMAEALADFMAAAEPFMAIDAEILAAEASGIRHPRWETSEEQAKALGRAAAYTRADMALDQSAQMAAIHSGNPQRAAAWREIGREAAAALDAMEAAYQPMRDLNARWEAALRIVGKAWVGLIAAPCRTAADVRAKATAMLEYGPTTGNLYVPVNEEISAELELAVLVQSLATVEG